jgi:hypothetical protein
VIVIGMDDLDLALDEVMFFEESSLALEWYAFFCIWFNGAVIPAASC